MSNKTDDTPVWVYLAALGFLLGVITGVDWLFANLYSAHTRGWDFVVMLSLSVVYITVRAGWAIWKDR